MKKQRSIVVLSIICVILAVFSIVCLLKLLRADQINSARLDYINDICVESVSAAKSSFQYYLDSGENESYLSGVCSFSMFNELYTESSYFDSAFAGTISSTCAILLDKDMTSQSVHLLIEALTYLSEDICDIRGYTYLEQFITEAPINYKKEAS